MEERYVLTFDIGTTGAKTCLYRMEDQLRLEASAMAGYGLTVLPNGGWNRIPKSGGRPWGKPPGRSCGRPGWIPG